MRQILSFVKPAALHLAAPPSPAHCPTAAPRISACWSGKKAFTSSLTPPMTVNSPSNAWSESSVLCGGGGGASPRAFVTRILASRRLLIS